MRYAAMLVLSCSISTSAIQAEMASAAPDPAGVSRALDGSVAFVASGGLWQAGGDFGPFRLVVIRGGVEHVSMRIYAQWLQFDATSGVDSVKLSAPVAELNNSLALVREVEIAEQGSNRIVFSLTCEPRDPGPLERILLELTRPGEMKVFPAGDRAKLATP